MLEGETIDAASESYAGGEEQQPMETAETQLGPSTALSAPTDLNALASLESGGVRTLDGELVSDEMEQDAINYQILLDKIDRLLERLKLDA